MHARTIFEMAIDQTLQKIYLRKCVCIREKMDKIKYGSRAEDRVICINNRNKIKINMLLCAELHRAIVPSQDKFFILIFCHFISEE